MSRSTAEAKYRVLASTTGELMWCVHLIKNIGYCVPLSTLYNDNINAIHIAKNPMFYHHTKHLEIDVHFVHEWVVSGVLSLAYILGSDQITDVFTKSFCATKFIPNYGKLCQSPTPP